MKQSSWMPEGMLGCTVYDDVVDTVKNDGADGDWLPLSIDRTTQSKQCE